MANLSDGHFTIPPLRILSKCTQNISSWYFFQSFCKPVVSRDVHLKLTSGLSPKELVLNTEQHLSIFAASHINMTNVFLFGPPLGRK